MKHDMIYSKAEDRRSTELKPGLKGVEYIETNPLKFQFMTCSGRARVARRTGEKIMVPGING
jgi:hypothetical protein